MKILYVIIVLLFCQPLWAASDSTVFNTAADFDMTYNDEGSGDANFGGATVVGLDDNYFENHISMRVTTLDDVLGAGSADRDYDSGIVYFQIATNGLDDNGEQLLVRGFPLIQVWTEGTGPTSSNDLTWNNYTTGTAWTAAGGDKGTEFTSRTQVLNFASGVEFDVVSLSVDTGYLRTMIEVDNTKGWMYTAEHDVLSPNDPFSFYSEDASPPDRRPYLVVYHTDKVAGEAVSTRRRKVLMTGGK